MLTLAEASDCGLQRMYHSRHFDRAEASGEIPKSYALTRGDSDAIDAERVTIAIPSLRSLRLRSE